MILCVDSGKRAAGCSLWTLSNSLLLGAQWVRAPDTRAEGPAAWRLLAELIGQWTHGVPVSHVVFETPSAYASDTPKRTLDLQDLVGMCGYLCALFPAARHTRLRPKEWKGTIDAEIVCARAWEALSEAEKARVVLPAPSYRHNVYDSIGIGLYITGRRGVAMGKKSPLIGHL